VLTKQEIPSRIVEVVTWWQNKLVFEN